MVMSYGVPSIGLNARNRMVNEIETRVMLERNIYELITTIMSKSNS